MSVQDNLIANEEIVFESEKHWIAPVRDSVVPALLLLGAYALGWISPDGHNGIVGAIGNLMDLVKTGLVIVAVGWIVYNIVLWRTAEFAVTNLRVIREEGLISRRSSATLLSSVTDVKTRVPFIGARLGYGDILIFTQSGEAGADRFSTITQPTAFRDRIMDKKMSDAGMASAAAAATASPAPAPVAAAPAPAPPDAVDTLARLAALRDSGAITTEEFEAKKAEILARI
jgi:uncharacterized membrane protein YdbT with pleckstrin-like domain